MNVEMMNKFFMQAPAAALTTTKIVHAPKKLSQRQKFSTKKETPNGWELEEKKTCALKGKSVSRKMLTANGSQMWLRQ